MKKVFYTRIMPMILTFAMVIAMGTAAYAEGGPGGTPPEMPDGQTGGAPGGGMPSGMGGGPGGSSGAPDSYTSVFTYSTDASESGKVYESAGTDENAILVTDGTVEISDATITRTSDNSTGGDQSSFYGVGAAALTTGGTLVVENSEITTNASGGAGVFAYGDGTAYVSDTTIKTEKGTSGGIHVAGGGTLYAWNLDVTTNGESAAAIRSDRGSGTMVVNGGTYTSNGLGSPAIYSTADIAVNNAALTANGSEAICIEGLNAIRLYDCDLTGNMPDQDQNDCTWTVIVYQSMSGDSQVGCGTFQMVGGSLTSANGGVFYTTNTESVFLLDHVDITAAEDSEFFLRCTGNSNARGWGTSGSNGADCIFTAIDQEMTGDIIWDTISTLNLYMEGSSTLTGAVLMETNESASAAEGSADIYLDSGAEWIVTGDSTVSDLYNEGTIRDVEGNTVTIAAADGTILVEGTSQYTVTVQSYSETADFSGAAVETAWSDDEVEKE